MSPETKLRDKPALTLVTDPELIEILEKDHLNGSLALAARSKAW